MQILLFVTLLFAAVSLVLTGVSHLCVGKACRRELLPPFFPRISVLKPLKGADEQLYENLRSLARQDYPEFEILAREFPEVRMRILAGWSPVGMNPKVNTLAILSEFAAHDCLLVSDSDVRADADYLKAIASELADPLVGLVCSVLVGAGERSLGSRRTCCSSVAAQGFPRRTRPQRRRPAQASRNSARMDLGSFRALGLGSRS